MWYSAVGGVVTLIVSLLVTPFVAHAHSRPGKFPGSGARGAFAYGSLPRRVSARAARAWLHRGPEYRHRVPLCHGVVDQFPHSQPNSSAWTLMSWWLRGLSRRRRRRRSPRRCRSCLRCPAIRWGVVSWPASPVRAGMPRGCPPASLDSGETARAPQDGGTPRLSRRVLYNPLNPSARPALDDTREGGPGSGRGVARPGGTPAERHGERVCGADGVPRPSTRSPIRCSAPDSPNWHSWPPRTACRPFRGRGSSRRSVAS